MKPFKLLFFNLLLLSLASCSDELENPTQTNQVPILVQFFNNQFTANENLADYPMTIVMHKPATVAGIITIGVTSDFNEAFTTEPAIVDGQILVPVAVGQTVVSFKLNPHDNDELDGNKNILFTIKRLSEGYELGEAIQLNVIIVDDELPATVNFLDEEGLLKENITEGIYLPIGFSSITKGQGAIEVELTSAQGVYGTYFTTEPAAINGKITLTVERDMSSVFIRFIPLNNVLINGHHQVQLKITSVTGSVVSGANVTSQIKIIDDELEGKGKGYSVGAGNWSYKRSYEYNQDGSVSKIHWEQNTPGTLAGTYSFYYNQSGQVIKRVESPFTEILYTWEAGRIVKEEKFTDGVLKRYTLYGYDDAGNVGEAAIHDRQPNGELKLSLLLVYLHRTDGNIYKQLTYVPIVGSEEYALISTRTFDLYLDTANPFSMMDILPNVNSQPNLPGSYRVQENGHDILYQFSYEFDENGKPVRRTATSSTGSEVTFYEYY